MTGFQLFSASVFGLLITLNSIVGYDNIKKNIELRQLLRERKPLLQLPPISLPWAAGYALSGIIGLYIFGSAIITAIFK